MTRAASALLAHSANYREELELHPCDAVPCLVHLQVVSWYSDAKGPSEGRVRYRTAVPKAALHGLRQAIDAVIADGERACG